MHAKTQNTTNKIPSSVKLVAGLIIQRAMHGNIALQTLAIIAFPSIFSIIETGNPRRNLSRNMFLVNVGIAISTIVESHFEP